MAINNGSIEVIADSGENYGSIITPLFPLAEGGSMAAGVKSRTGVQLGSKVTTIPADELARMGSGFYGRWNGTFSDGSRAIVNIYQTAEGGA